MASVVDELTVSLGLDASGFKKGQTEARADLKATSDAATRTAKDMEARGAQAAQFFGQIKVEALSLIGLLVGGKGLETFARDATKSLADMGRAASHIGANVADVTAFGNMIARSGGSAEQATQSLVGLTDAMESYRISGDSPMANFFSNMGIERGDNALTAYMKFVKFAQDHAKDVPLINMMGHGIGLDQATIDATVQMGTVAKAQAALAQSYHLGVPDADMVKRMQDLQSATVGLGQAAEHSGEVLLAKLAPGLTATANAISELIVKYPQLANAVLAAIAVLSGGKVALWMLRALGLTTIAEGVLGTEMIYQGTRIGGLNEGEQAEVDRLRAAAGLPARGSTGEIGSERLGLGTYNAGAPALHRPMEGTPAASVMERLRAFYKAKGLDDAHIAGILANVSAESGFSPDVSVDDGGKEAYGLFQYRGSRLTALRARYGAHPTVEQQAQFAYDEGQTTEGGAWSRFMAAQGAVGSGAAFTGFERPADPNASAIRGRAAPQFLDRGLVPPAGAGAVGQSVSVHIGSVTVNTQATDAKGMASAAKRAIQDSWASQADRALQ